MRLVSRTLFCALKVFFQLLPNSFTSHVTIISALKRTSLFLTIVQSGTLVSYYLWQALAMSQVY